MIKLINVSRKIQHCTSELYLFTESKLSKLFATGLNPIFDECPSCYRSQMEYYCNIYCNPRQDYFLRVNQLFEDSTNSGQGVYNFTGPRLSQYFKRHKL